MFYRRSLEFTNIFKWNFILLKKSLLTSAPLTSTLFDYFIYHFINYIFETTNSNPNNSIQQLYPKSYKHFLNSVIQNSNQFLIHLQAIRNFWIKDLGYKSMVEHFLSMHEILDYRCSPTKKKYLN
jgi:hypothetical protein